MLGIKCLKIFLGVEYPIASAATIYSCSRRKRICPLTSLAIPGHEKTDLQYVEYAWGGIGYYCYGGKCEKIYWQKGTPLEALRLYYLNEDGSCSDTPVEINTGKSYVAVTDVDFAGNFVHSTLESVNLSNATTQTYEKNYVEDDAKAGETLGSSTDDLTAAATGSGSAEG